MDLQRGLRFFFNDIHHKLSSKTTRKLSSFSEKPWNWFSSLSLKVPISLQLSRSKLAYCTFLSAQFHSLWNKISDVHSCHLLFVSQKYDSVRALQYLASHQQSKVQESKTEEWSSYGFHFEWQDQYLYEVAIASSITNCRMADVTQRLSLRPSSWCVCASSRI